MYYSTKTTNKSFIDMWRFLQRNEIDNNLFMLQTHHKELVDFSIEKFMSMNRDDPSFTKYKSMIIDEARNNIWFYFRELVVVPDTENPLGFSHFELTPKTMMMIYLYDHGISFINRDSSNSDCLHFIWNLQKSLYNNDIVFMSQFESIEHISSTIKKYIAKMECQVPFGCTQALSDNTTHWIGCDFDYLRMHATFDDAVRSLESTLSERIENYIKKSSPTYQSPILFILEDDMPVISYSIFLNVVNNRYRMYFNGLQDKLSMNSCILYNTLLSFYPVADSYIFDISEPELQPLYLI